ncbi:MAG: ABC transporter ATP-binding protein [Alicyclobacillus sp.]|nr:ABC transporter ATP-binding protein [Alicyclobacillus sp.]
MLAAQDYAIRVRNVTKAFRIYQGKNTTLKERILYAGKARYCQYVALQDVSLDVPRGSTIGLIGVNGSGKSTLLKLISRILYPDSGYIEVNGRVSSLLELGAGFHPDFSGRENIFMNGALLGLSKRDIASKLDEIIGFSELNGYIDQPVRSYSSGMYMRLAFSVAVAVDPDILLIDEILAVGDAAFQAKCMSRLRHLQQMKKTIVIVTHDTQAVERFCDMVVWLDDSRVRMIGKPSECVDAYLRAVFGRSERGEAVKSSGEVRLESSDPVKANHAVLKAAIREVRVLTGEDGVVRTGLDFQIRITLHVEELINEAVIGLRVTSEEGTEYYGTSTLADGLNGLRLESGEYLFVVSVESSPLLAGLYWLDVWISDTNGIRYDYKSRAASIRAVCAGHETGVVRIPHVWKFKRTDESVPITRKEQIVWQK